MSGLYSPRGHNARFDGAPALEFRFGPYEREAAFYAALADHFEACAVGLNFVHNDLRPLANPRYAWIRAALG